MVGITWSSSVDTVDQSQPGHGLYSKQIYRESAGLLKPTQHNFKLSDFKIQRLN